jgi:hypothetical protein
MMETQLTMTDVTQTVPLRSVVTASFKSMKTVMMEERAQRVMTTVLTQSAEISRLTLQLARRVMMGLKRLPVTLIVQSLNVVILRSTLLQVKSVMTV